MAIVKMSKINVIGLLDDKEKVYTYLQNNASVHIKMADDFDGTIYEKTDDKVEKLQSKKDTLDEIIDFIVDFTEQERVTPVTMQEIESVRERRENLEKHKILEKCSEIKNKVKELKTKLDLNGDLIVTLIKHREENLSTLVKNKVISPTIIEKESDNMTASEMIEKIKKDNENIKSELAQIKEQLLHFEYLKDLKLESSLLSQDIEKAKCDGKIRKTESTFILQFYLPKEESAGILESLQKLSPTIVCEEMKIKREDNVPTLTKNDKLTKQAEFVTNMYSVPSYHETDPNKLLFWFYMIFFGYIMADIGLGIALIVIGYGLAKKQIKESGSQKLWTLIGTGGIFSIFWGILYNSMFGFKILPFTIMPNPQNEAILTLLICLFMGVIHIACGYFMKGLNAIKNGSITDAIFDAFLWDTFFLGAIMALAKFLLNFFNLVDFTQSGVLQSILSAIQLPGLIILLTSLLLIMIFAGRKSKGFGKLTKAFTSLYGIINLFSDILSYARLFGLMLSGAIIGEQFDNIGISLMNSGAIGVVFGIVVIIIGNAFNLAMGALGAYIHDCRLQYIEYFGKFYTGEGELYTPFKPVYKYVTIKSDN